MKIDLAGVLTRFETWRNSRQNRREKIPDELWALACELSRKHGAAQVAKMLRVNHTELKRRASGVAPQAVGLPAVRVTPLIVHREEPRPVEASKKADPVAELSGTNGLRMTLFEGITSELAKTLLSLALEVK